MQDSIPLPSPEIVAFTMEIGIRSDFPTYSGGLGVLAGDTARAAADLELPYAVVTLAHRMGYLHQRLEEDGSQVDAVRGWDPSGVLRELKPRVQVRLENREVAVRGWEYRLEGVSGHPVPIYFLDTDLEENASQDRRITDQLYGGDARRRLQQEAVLGIGGIKLLRELDFRDVHTFHMNEGHSALLTLALLEEVGSVTLTEPGGLLRAAGVVRQRCVFTTHTPVAAGHDRFPVSLVRDVLGERRTALLRDTGCVEEEEINLTRVALHFSRFTNGVALRHAMLSREMFPGQEIHPITNGVHAATWTGAPFRRLFDRHLAGWREDPYLLRQAVGIPLDEIREAHRAAKDALLAEVERRTGMGLDAGKLTVAFARRAAPYKRADLLLSDPARLLEAARRHGGLQLLYAGKAHPRDETGKKMIRRVVEGAKHLGDQLPLVYLEDYDMELGHLLAAGADLWLNHPRKPLEASGTSGMKAALNGVPCLSILDGWWIEGHVEGVTGWAIDDSWEDPADDESEFMAMISKLEGVILPLYYGDPVGWSQVMRQVIAFNGSYFHARRMLQEYLARPYRVARRRHGFSPG